MNTKTIVMVLLVVIVVGGAGVVIMQGQAPGTQTGTSASPAVEFEESTGDAMMQIDDQEASTGQEFTVEGANFSYSVTEMRVKQGETVRVHFVNSEGFHDWVLDEFNAKTQQLQAGQSETIEFVAGAPGTYEYYCSVGNHRAQGMVGTLIVE